MASEDLNQRPQADESSGNGSGEIRPCLIGGFRGLTGTSPSYWNVFECIDGTRFSVDMVRLSISFRGAKSGEWVKDHGGIFDCDDLATYAAKVKPGGWYVLYTYGFGESTAALGIGHFKPTCAIDMTRGFLEFNPNKVASDTRFWKLFERLAPYVSHAELKRFDLAYDVPRPKNKCYLNKDRRRYEAVISNGVTEYLGIKNSPGFVKVYDKAAELHLDDGVELTRIELTCDGEWDAEKLVSQWPQVHAWTQTEATRDWVVALALALSRLAELGEEVETIVNLLGKKSRPKIRAHARGPLVELPDGAAALAIAEARSWAERFERQ